MWCDNDDDNFPLPQAIKMLVTLQELEISMASLPCSLLGDASLQQSDMRAAVLCNELAVSVLAWLKNSPSAAAKSFSAEVQILSQQMNQAGKRFLVLSKQLPQRTN